MSSPSNSPVPFPPFYRLERTFPESKPVNIPDVVATQFEKLIPDPAPPAGARIGIAVGSRGISNLDILIGSVVSEIESRGWKAAIVPAMGSHGGASAEGQQQTLVSLGLGKILERIPCLPSMETTQLGTSVDGVPVLFSQPATELDGLIICNRIKAHTGFTGEVQSGILKMLTIGLGKQLGAKTYHRATKKVSFDTLVRNAVEIVLQKIPCWGGLAVLEDYEHQICSLTGLRANELVTEEPKLLQKSFELLPQFPLPEIDLLIIDEIGKEISGTGMDTNVIGRKYRAHESTKQDRCQTNYIHIRGLTKKTNGNATGIGLAEFTLKRAAAEVDWPKTQINTLTAGRTLGAMCPLLLETDREVFEVVSQLLERPLKVVHIKNTLELKTIWVSQPCLTSIQEQEPEATATVDHQHYEQLLGF